MKCKGFLVFYPKLSWKKKEDRKHGLSVKRKRTEKGDIIIESQEPKEYSDKFTGSKYKGSKFNKNSETVFFPCVVEGISPRRIDHIVKIFNIHTGISAKGRRP